MVCTAKINHNQVKDGRVSILPLKKANEIEFIVCYVDVLL